LAYGIIPHFLTSCIDRLYIALKYAFPFTYQNTGGRYEALPDTGSFSVIFLAGNMNNISKLEQTLKEM